MFLFVIYMKQRIGYKAKLKFTFLLFVFLILLHISTNGHIIEGNKIVEQSNEIFVLKQDKVKRS